MRLDQALVARGLASSRSVAARLIASGAVQVDGEQIVRAAHQVAPEAALGVLESPENRFVSRAGAKLDGLLAARRDIRVHGYWVDLGQGTGGFTACLLVRGARRVLGIEVGHAQLHPELRIDPRVRACEGVNARDLHQAVQPAALDAAWPVQGADGVVVDLSFISLLQVLEPAAALLATPGCLIALIKPQFELGADGATGACPAGGASGAWRADRAPGACRADGAGEAGRAARARSASPLRRGVVRDASVYPQVLARIVQCLDQLGLHVDPSHDLVESCLPGLEGNREFFVVARKAIPAGGAGAHRSEL